MSLGRGAPLILPCPFTGPNATKQKPVALRGQHGGGLGVTQVKGPSDCSGCGPALASVQLAAGPRLGCWGLLSSEARSHSGRWSRTPLPVSHGL